MNPNLWQNRTGSETERGTSWEYGEQRGSALSAALSVQESFPHSPHCWHKGTAGKGSDCTTCSSQNSSSHHSSCTSTNVLKNSHKKPKTYSGSLGFGCWTDSKAMERRLYLHLLCERRQLAGRRSESAAGDVSQVARGLFQRAGGNWHCACTATGLLRPEHMM